MQHQLFNGPLSGTVRVSRCQKKHSPTHWEHLRGDACYLIGFMVQGEVNGGRHIDSPAGSHPIRTIGALTFIIPTILRATAYML